MPPCPDWPAVRRAAARSPVLRHPATATARSCCDEPPQPTCAAVVGLLADDQLGATREDPGDLAAYLPAFAAIDADPRQLLVVLDDGGDVVGTMQVTSSLGSRAAARCVARSRRSGWPRATAGRRWASR